GITSAACHSLEELEDAAAPAVPALVAMVRDTQNPSPAWAIIALGRIGPGAQEAVPDLISVLSTKSASVRIREESAIALGRIGDARPEVVREVRQALEDNRIAVQRGCLEGLYRLGW